MHDPMHDATPPSEEKRSFKIGKSGLLAIAIAIIVTLWLISGLISGDDSTPDTAKITPAQQAQKTSDQQTAVRFAVSQAQDMQHTIKVNGLTPASRSVNLSSEITGKIAAIHIEEGSIVEDSKKILSITTEDRSSLVSRAEESVQQRKIEFDSAQELHKKGFVSDARLAEARAALNEAQANLERAQVNLENTTINAPFKGILEETHVEIGDVVSVGTVLATFLDLMPAEFVAYVSEKNVRNIMAGASATALLVDGSEIPLNVSYVAAQADPQTRTFLIKLTYDNADMQVVAGMTTRIVIPVATQKAHFIPPSILTLNEEGQVGIKAVNAESTVQFYPIEILQSTAKGIWVNRLPDTLDIIVVGQEFVATGENVKAVEVDSSFLPVQHSSSAGES